MTFLFYFQPFLLDGYFITQNERSIIIKDDLFQGNEDAYYLTENAFAFAASAMIPIGQASTAGNMTLLLLR